MLLNCGDPCLAWYGRKPNVLLISIFLYHLLSWFDRSGLLSQNVYSHKNERTKGYLEEEFNIPVDMMIAQNPDQITSGCFNSKQVHVNELKIHLKMTLTMLVKLSERDKRKRSTRLCWLLSILIYDLVEICKIFKS